MFSLIYCSTVNEKFSGDHALQQILEESRQHNESQGITGMLLFSSKYFLQYIEGSRDAVNHAYARIMKSSSHHNIQLLNYQQIAHRNFPAWHMQYIPLTDEMQVKLFRFSQEKEFNPYKMNGETALGLLTALNTI